MQKITKIAESSGLENYLRYYVTDLFANQKRTVKGKRIISKEESGVAERPQTLFIIIRKKDGYDKTQW